VSLFASTLKIGEPHSGDLSKQFSAMAKAQGKYAGKNGKNQREVHCQPRTFRLFCREACLAD
jgi:hypothetical protein